MISLDLALFHGAAVRLGREAAVSAAIRPSVATLGACSRRPEGRASLAGYNPVMADRVETPSRRLTAEQQRALLRPPQVTDAAERRDVIRRATTGLRLEVPVTKDMYRPQ